MHEVYRKLKYFSRKQISELYIFNKKIDYKFKSNKYFLISYLYLVILTMINYLSQQKNIWKSKNFKKDKLTVT